MLFEAPSTYAEPWRQFQQPLVRQLAFCVGSYNIIQGLPADFNAKHQFDFHTDIFWQQHFLNYLPRLRHLDQHPQALENFLAPLKSTRLGLRFEYLLWFWLLERDYHPYEVLGHSLQQRVAQQTIGELDFLLYNHQQQQIEHWEVALKYYLAEADAQLEQWYGLNRQDTLARKLRHFSDKQFQFTQVENYAIQQRYAVLKGQLYLPQHYHANLPTWLNPTRRLGYWGTQIYPTQFYRLQRREWICQDVCPSSSAHPWWSIGLYQMLGQETRYMYRPDLAIPYVLNRSPRQ